MQTSTGLTVELKQENPAYHLLSQCAIFHFPIPYSL
ncbi:putative lipid-A-disaccharide synthase [Sphaerospermopsis reniformis]|uniref:Putative lipid-A-disaccharide synthase n=1 Tax=Sphaerospermopsis reniformis TaxID=531300 RepID=A0A480A936_9CYAN|nr:putative lipid-A-disaccharide synthase [Sphaerospermopsis reniformis]